MNITDIEKYAWFSNLAYVEWNSDNTDTNKDMAKAAIDAKRAPKINGVDQWGQTRLKFRLWF